MQGTTNQSVCMYLCVCFTYRLIQPDSILHGPLTLTVSKYYSALTLFTRLVQKALDCNRLLSCC